MSKTTQCSNKCGSDDIRVYREQFADNGRRLICCRVCRVKVKVAVKDADYREVDGVCAPWYVNPQWGADTAIDDKA